MRLQFAIDIMEYLYQYLHNTVKIIGFKRWLGGHSVKNVASEVHSGTSIEESHEVLHRLTFDLQILLPVID